MRIRHKEASVGCPKWGLRSRSWDSLTASLGVRRTARVPERADFGILRVRRAARHAPLIAARCEETAEISEFVSAGHEARSRGVLFPQQKNLGCPSTRSPPSSRYERDTDSSPPSRRLASSVASSVTRARSPSAGTSAPMTEPMTELRDRRRSFAVDAANRHERDVGVTRFPAARGGRRVRRPVRGSTSCSSETRGRTRRNRVVGKRTLEPRCRAWKHRP